MSVLALWSVLPHPNFRDDVRTEPEVWAMLTQVRLSDFDQLVDAEAAVL